MDRKDNKKIKNIFSFTLAEMMVILAIFSAISAATLPVVTAKNQLGDSITSSSGSTTSTEPWVIDDSYNGMGYVSDSNANKTAIILGGALSEDTTDIAAHGYPQVVIRNNATLSSTVPDSSHIVLLRKSGSSAYYSGRISFGDEKGSYIAAGAYPLQYNGNYERYNYGSIALGTYAGSRIQTGDTGNYIDNIAVGYYSGVNFTSISSRERIRNIYLGAYSGRNTYGSSSVYVGTYSGAYSTSSYPAQSSYSIYVGNYAGYHQPSSSAFQNANYSVGIGYFSGANATLFNNSVAIGNYAGASYGTTAIPQTISFANVYLGNYAGYYASTTSTVNANAGVVAIGYYAGASNQTGGSTYSTTFIGPFAGYGAYAGSGGVYVGYYAGGYYNYSNSAGRKANLSKLSPILIGMNAGRGAISYNNVSDNKSPIVIGNNALVSIVNDIGMPDVLIGENAGSNDTSSIDQYYDGSVIIGHYAASGNGAPKQPIVKRSVCIGEYACSGYLWSATTYSASAYHDVRIATYSNTRLDYQGHSFIANRLESDTLPPSSVWNPYSDGYNSLLLSPLGASPATYSGSAIVLYANSIYGPTTTMKTWSDRRLKENIKPTKYNINDLRKINIYEYNMKADKTKEKKIGVIAQELQKVIPEAVFKNSDGYFMILSDWIQYVVIQSIKDLDNTVTNLSNQVNSYVKEYNTLLVRVKTLEKEINELEKENKTLTHEVKVAYKKAKKAESKK